MKKIFWKKPILELEHQLHQKNLLIQEITSVLTKLSEGNRIEISDTVLSDTDLGNAFEKVQNRLEHMDDSDNHFAKLNECHIKISELTQSTSANSADTISRKILFLLNEYIAAIHSSIYMVDEDAQLKMVAGFGMIDGTNQEFLKPGEGLIGQCALMKTSIILTEIPDEFFAIASGLGQTKPRYVMIFPLISEGELVGVVELAALKEFSEEEKSLIGKISSPISACFKSIRDNTKIRKLLVSSQKQAEELAAQEEELRSNLEEIARKSDEITRQTAESMGLIQGIDATMAMIEFTPEGFVRSANQNFLSTMGYPMSGIKGKHHRMFVPDELQSTTEYVNLWKSLALGNASTGTFKRIDSSGKTVWLRAIYNPIRNSDGTVNRIVKLATDITKEKEMQASNEGVLQGVDATMAIIEFTPEGKIITANKNFLAAVNYKSEDIKGKHHRMFVPEEIQNSSEYKKFWNDLSIGKAASGTFKRIGANGKTVWLRAIYNPIRNSDGTVNKVIKFATDITKEKEMQASNEGVLQGVDATMAVIEFTPDGNIITANKNFLTSVHYSLEDIKGKHHSMFVPEEIQQSSEYKNFWSELAVGKAMSGTFERMDSKGKTVWLRAMYNPIRNSDGTVSKVIKFATDITREMLTV